MGWLLVVAAIERAGRGGPAGPYLVALVNIVLFFVPASLLMLRASILLGRRVQWWVQVTGDRLRRFGRGPR